MTRIARPLGAHLVLAMVFLACAFTPKVHAQFHVPDGLSPAQAQRFKPFESFRINGVCGVRDLERLSRFGVNTVRGYTIPGPESMRATLDEAHSHGIKMIVSEWMPHQGENKDKRGWTWTYDYDTQGDAMVEGFIEKLEAIGDHPAILMWGLGNEVPLEEPYLRVVNRMSLAVHERFPEHLTSLTMINAKPEAIENIKRYAPDLDVLGVQSYSPGAVRNSIAKVEEHWGKPFYFSEFNSKGPWNFPKTDWGEALDEPVDRKVRDLEACYDAIDASPLSMGSTIFVWGYFQVNRPTYFSLLLDTHPDGREASASPANLLLTPQAELVVERFSGTPYMGNRAPVLTKLETADGARWLTCAPAESAVLSVEATDAESDPVRFRCWVLDSKPNRPKAVGGPFEFAAGETVAIQAPDTPGNYLVMVYAVDGHGGGSASTLPLAVR